MNFLIFLKLMLCSVAFSQSRAPIVLMEGEQRLFSIDGLQKYSIGDHRVVRAIRPPKNSLNPNQLLIKGKGVGLTQIWIWKSDSGSESQTVLQPIRVVQWSAQGGDRLEMLRTFSQLNEVEVIPIGNRFLLRGYYSTEREAEQIQTILKLHPLKVENKSRPTPSYLNQLEVRLLHLLESQKNFHHLQLDRVEGDLFLHGSLPEKWRPPLVRSVTAIHPLIPIDFQSLTNHQGTIFLRVLLLEVSRTAFHSFGMDWSGRSERAAILTSRSIRTEGEMEAGLNLLEGEGNGRVLAAPELAVKAPGKARLFAGGQIPIALKGRYQSEVKWKNYGLLLKIHVEEREGKWLRIELDTSMSHLDPTTSFNEIPGIRSNELKTTVDVEMGRPLFLTGLLQDHLRESSSGIPGLKHLPILGSLFGSENYIKNRSELVVVLIPHSKTPLPPSQLDPALEFPKGPIPPPRNWIHPADLEQLRKSPDYPWNALKEEVQDE